MTTAATDEKDPKEKPATDPPKADPPAKPAADAGGGTAADKPKGAAAADAGTGGDAGSKRVTLKDNDEIPEDVELVELSTRALKGRLDRHTKKELKARFGTDDIDSITKKLKLADDLTAKEEERRRAALDEKARLEEDVKKANERATQADQRAEAVLTERVFEKQENRMVKLASKHIDPDYIDAHLPALAEHLNATYSKKELLKLKDTVIEKWWADLATSKPKFALDAGSTKTEPEKRPHTNGTGSEKPDKKDATDKDNPANGKTFRPGQPNSMSTREVKAELAKQGIRY